MKWIKMWNTYTIEYYSVIQENDTLPFPTTWVDLEGIMLKEVWQRKENTLRSHLYVKSKKKKNPLTKPTHKNPKLTDTVNRLVARGEEWEIGEKWVKGVKKVQAFSYKRNVKGM